MKVELSTRRRGVINQKIINSSISPLSMRDKDIVFFHLRSMLAHRLTDFDKARDLKKAINAILLALKLIQEAVNHGGKLQSIEHNHYGEIDQQLFHELTERSEFKQRLEILCVHRKVVGIGNQEVVRHWNWWGSNYTRSAKNLRSWLKQKLAKLEASQQLEIVQQRIINKLNHDYRIKTVAFDFKMRKWPPRVLDNLQNIQKVVVGDLHGNFHKLVDHFIRVGALTFKEANNYANLIRNPDLIEEYINEGQLQVNSEHPKLLLLGDIFADRNKNDNAKLKLLDFLSNQHCQFSIIYSNHDESFLRYLQGLPMHSHNAHKTFIRMETPILFENLFKKHYIFAEYENGYFFSHAPLTALDFNNLARLAHVNPEASFAEQVDRINLFLQESYPKLEKLKEFVWRRWKEWEFESSRFEASIANCYNLKQHISGHDAYPISLFNLSLDNLCGKFENAPLNNEESILIFIKPIIDSQQLYINFDS